MKTEKGRQQRLATGLVSDYAPALRRTGVGNSHNELGRALENKSPAVASGGRNHDVFGEADLGGILAVEYVTGDVLGLGKGLAAGQDRVAAVAVAALEIIAAHAVFGLGVADDRLDGGTALHLAPDQSGHSADLAGDPDPELLLVIVAAIALVDVDAAGFDPGQFFEVGERGCPCWSASGAP